MKILVVDDERTLVKGIKFNLENEGYQVECAYDGAAAVELARRIVEHREANGLFETIEELMEVSGIGEGKFADLEGRITVNGEDAE